MSTENVSLAGIPTPAASRPDLGRFGPPKVENLRLLRETVRGLRESQFDMGAWANFCGTKFCAGGWLFTKNPHLGVTYRFDAGWGRFLDREEKQVDDMVGVLADTLGMPYDDAGELFSPQFDLDGNEIDETPDEWLARLDAWLAEHAPAALEPRPARVPSPAEAAAERSAAPELCCETDA